MPFTGAALFIFVWRCEVKIPFSPVIDGVFLQDHPFYMFQNGIAKPDGKTVIEYAHDEGEQFIEEIFYPLEDPILGNDQTLKFLLNVILV